MVDPDKRGGLKLDGVYRPPATAVLSHPEIWLLVAILGIVPFVISQTLCPRAPVTLEPFLRGLYTSWCVIDLRGLGLALIGAGLIPYTVHSLYRRVRRKGG